MLCSFRNIPRKFRIQPVITLVVTDGSLGTQFRDGSKQAPATIPNTPCVLTSTSMTCAPPAVSTCDTTIAVWMLVCSLLAAMFFL
jgi:hypothetical protein